MKQSIVVLSLALAAGTACARAAHAPAAAASDPSTVAAAAAGSAQPGTPQRSKMKACNVDAKAKDLHGPDRRAFMKQCLSGKARPAATS